MAADSGRDLLLFLGRSFPGPTWWVSLLHHPWGRRVVWLFIGENSTDWLPGLDYLFVLRCCEEIYFMLFKPCLALLIVLYILKIQMKEIFGLSGKAGWSFS